MSTHEAKVVLIEKIEPHPDPETVNLGLVRVWDYQVVVNRHQWKEGALAVYIEPDTVVDGNRDEFSFLNGDKEPRKHRIKVKRLRGVWSEGLLIPAPAGLNLDDDAWELLSLERYVPQMKRRNGSRPANLDSDFSMAGQWESAPISLPFGKYDLENWKKWNKIFQIEIRDESGEIVSVAESDEEVFITEKIHGANAKYAFIDGRFYCGSRSGWKKEDEKCSWWQALYQSPWLKGFLSSNPNIVLFGEIFGQVQDLKYGAKKNEIFFRAFDIFLPEERRFMDAKRFHELLDGDKTAPVLYRGPYSKEIVLQMTDGLSMVPGANHVREGCVIKPATEQIHHRLGRVALKNVSNEYLLRA